MDKKKNIYDGINLSVRVLTCFIIIGIILLASIITFGYLQGNSGGQELPASAEMVESSEE